MSINVVTVENFPEWAVMYVAYGNTTDLTEEEIGDIEEFKRENGLRNFLSIGDESFFSSCPAFGLPTTCVEAYFETA